MALKQEAEQLRELAVNIIEAEMLRAKIQASGGTIEVNGDPRFTVPLSQAQRTALLAIEDTWKQDAKAITALW